MDSKKLSILVNQYKRSKLSFYILLISGVCITCIRLLRIYFDKFLPTILLESLRYVGPMLIVFSLFDLYSYKKTAKILINEGINPKDF